MTETAMTSEPLVIKTTNDDRDTSNDLIPFVLDDRPDDPPYIGTRPKMAVLLRVLSILSDGANEIGQAIALDRLLDKIVDEESCDRIRERFEDRDDTLDILDLTPILQVLAARWYGSDPSQGRPGSRRSPSATTRRSTARARSGA